MTLEFKLPELGDNIDKVEIIQIMISNGQNIEVDQILLELETDKATIEVPAEFSGVIKEVKAKQGDIVATGDLIFTYQETTNTEASTTKEKPNTQTKEVKTTTPQEVATSPKPIEKTETPVAKPIPVRSEFGRKIAPAAPTVRRFSREIGVNINEVNGSGPGGRISIDDVKLYTKSINELVLKSGGIASLGVKQEKLPDFSKWGNIQTKPMSNVRRKTAEHLSYAWSSIPHVTQFDKADITELEKIRKQYAKTAEAYGGKLTITAILMKVVASAMKTFPIFNTSVDMIKKEIIHKDYCHIGIAVDTEKGLIVPVVRDVDKKNILELSKDLTDISVKARNKKVTLADMQGGCFTISNLGGIGGTAFTPIVNSPEVAILGVSRGSYEPVYIDGEFVPRLMLPLSLSYDHRVIDGADAARFIKWVSAALEQPFLLSLEG